MRVERGHRRDGPVPRFVARRQGQRVELAPVRRPGTDQVWRLVARHPLEHERDPVVYAAGVRAAIDAVAAGRLDPEPLLTHSYPLERLDEALNATRDRPDGFLKALVVP